MIWWLDRLTTGAARTRGYKSRFVDLGQGRAHLIEARGTGEVPVVLVNGLGSNASDWMPLLGAVRRHASVVWAVDLPEHGLSDPPPGGADAASFARAVRSVMDAVVTEPAVLIGSSLGGLIALRFALERPGLARGLVLSGPAGAPFEPSEQAFMDEVFMGATGADARAFIDRAFDRPPFPPWMMLPALRRRLGRPVVRAVMRALDDGFLLAPEDLRRLRVPVRVLWGEHDRVLPARHRLWFEDHLPGGSVKVLPGVGHVPHIEAPDEVLAALDEVVRLA